MIGSFVGTIFITTTNCNFDQIRKLCEWKKKYVTFCGSFYHRRCDQFLYGYYIILLVTIYHKIIESPKAST